jgi:prepilin-type processing-associated H-X9-DG protein
VFLCPSDGEPEHQNNYRWNRGRWPVYAMGPILGPFSPHFLPRPASIRDGLGSTAFVSERLAGTFVLGRNDPLRDVRTQTPPYRDYWSIDEFTNDCLTTDRATWVHESGRYWFYTGLWYTDYDHSGRPNDRRPSCGAWYGLHPPRSFHGGIVNVLYGDGHVAPVTSSIDQAAWAALGTPNARD